MLVISITFVVNVSSTTSSSPSSSLTPKDAELQSSIIYFLESSYKSHFHEPLPAEDKKSIRELTTKNNLLVSNMIKLLNDLKNGTSPSIIKYKDENIYNLIKLENDFHDFIIKSNSYSISYLRGLKYGAYTGLMISLLYFGLVTTYYHDHQQKDRLDIGSLGLTCLAIFFPIFKCGGIFQVIYRKWIIESYKEEIYYTLNQIDKLTNIKSLTELYLIYRSNFHRMKDNFAREDTYTIDIEED